MLAIIIFGTRGVRSTVKQGRFYCPQCDSDKDYKHKKVTQFFTLYFIPVIPLGNKGEYVECQTCNNTFIERVLHLKPRVETSPTVPVAENDTSSIASPVMAAATPSTGDFLSEKQKAIKKLLIMMILADGKVQDSEIHAFHKVYRETTQKVVDDIYSEIEQVRMENKSARQYLKEVSGYLNDEGKEEIIRAAILIAKADGEVDTSELEMIGQLGKSLDMTSDQVKRAMAV